MTVEFPFVTSAPGKVILFGEHSAVFNKPAIAAALSLRTYVLVTRDTDNTDYVALEFPDIGFHHKWLLADLPFHKVPVSGEDGKPVPTEALSPELTNEISQVLADIDSPLFYGAAYAFLYIFLCLCTRDIPGGLTFTARSTLPIGAGLGSSASISVALTGAFAYISGHVQVGTLTRTSKTFKDSEDCKFLDSWAFMGEKCIHGNPSGIDNAVATHGGAIMFQRQAQSMPNIRTAMRNLPPMNLLLTNTRTPRRTANLVAGVSQVCLFYPKSSTHILDAMEAVANEAYNVMLRPQFDKASKDKLQTLVRINHGLLVSLGVSHPNLEKIKVASDELDIGQTKLTGAGGGGCAITLLKDDVEKEKLAEMEQRMLDLGFEPFHGTLGGKGVGLLVPSTQELSDMLTVETFKGFDKRTEIENAVGCSKIPEWRFW